VILIWELVANLMVIQLGLYRLEVAAFV